jgi:hypothetical protein
MTNHRDSTSGEHCRSTSPDNERSRDWLDDADRQREPSTDSLASSVAKSFSGPIDYIYKIFWATATEPLRGNHNRSEFALSEV